MMIKDAGGPDIALQVLICPVTDYNFETLSYKKVSDGYGVTRDLLIWFWRHYLEYKDTGPNPYVSPLRSNELSNLPPALVLTAEYDPLRDEGDAYADALSQAGVQAHHRRYAGMIHGFFQMISTVEPAREALEETVATIQYHLGMTIR